MGNYGGMMHLNVFGGPSSPFVPCFVGWNPHRKGAADRLCWSQKICRHEVLCTLINTFYYFWQPWLYWIHTSHDRLSFATVPETCQICHNGKQPSKQPFDGRTTLAKLHPIIPQLPWKIPNHLQILLSRRKFSRWHRSTQWGTPFLPFITACSATYLDSTTYSSTFWYPFVFSWGWHSCLVGFWHVRRLTVK